MKSLLLILLNSFICSLPLFAQAPGTVDSTFGNNGVAITPTIHGEFQQLFVQRDDRLVAVNIDDTIAHVVRYDADARRAPRKTVTLAVKIQGDYHLKSGSFSYI